MPISEKGRETHFFKMLMMLRTNENSNNMSRELCHFEVYKYHVPRCRIQGQGVQPFDLIPIRLVFAGPHLNHPRSTPTYCTTSRYFCYSSEKSYPHIKICRKDVKQIYLVHRIHGPPQDMSSRLAGKDAGRCW